LFIAVILVAILGLSQHLLFAFSFASDMSSSPKQSYQAQIDTLSDRLDHQNERFDQLEAKIGKLTRAFEKLPMLDQPQTPELLVGGSDRRKWVVYKSGRPNEFEDKESEHSNFMGREQGGELRHGQREPRDRQFETPRDDRRAVHYREPRTTDHNVDRRNVHESYSDITRKVKVDVPSLMEK